MKLIMQSLPVNPILRYNANTLEEVRRSWNLDKEERFEESIKILQDWLKKQDHFKNKNFDPRYLEGTIITCKGSLEKVKRQLDRICALRTLLPKYFVHRDVRILLQNFVERNFIWSMYLPKMTKDHYRVLLVKFNPIRLAAADLIQFYQVTILLGLYGKAHDYANGFILILDFRQVNIVDIITKVNIMELQQFATILIEGLGARVKGIHLLTESKSIDLLVKTVKSVLSAKIGGRIQTHRNTEDLYIVIERDIFPVDYGGKERPSKQLYHDWIEVLSLEENERYFVESFTFCSDENRRSEEKYNEQVMGLPGSFRTLHVD